MRAPRKGNWARHFTAVWIFGASWTINAEAATIAGVVRDTQGIPLGGVKIHLIGAQSTKKSVQGSSGKDGEYRFTELPPGKYQLSAELSGFNVVTSAVVAVPEASATVVKDFTLSRLTQEGAATAPPPLKFEAAGIRGLIDPGGYSAPANAAAASGLISGIADIRRAENGAGFPSAEDLPCNLEPELTKTATANSQSADANRQLGEFYLAHGLASRAVPYLERARKIDSTDARAVRDLSEALLMSGQFDSARQLLISLPEGPRVADFHRLLARAEEGSGHFTSASEQYQIAFEESPSEENIFGVGYELILAGRTADASIAFRTGMAKYPRSLTLLIGAGTAEFLQGRSSAAVQLFLQATDLDPSDARPYPFLAGAFGISGQEGVRVNASLKRHLGISSTDAKAYYFYALSLSRVGEAVDNAQVETLLKQAIVLDPNLAKAHFELGTLYAYRHDYESAAREFETTVRLVPAMKEAHYRLASAYKRTGRADAAEREMALFREAKNSIGAGSGDEEISVEQFISVVNQPGQALASPIPCSTNVKQ